MRRIRQTRAGRTLLISSLIAALAAGLAGPLTHAAPTDPIGTLDHFSVDQAERTAAITDPGSGIGVTTTMLASTVKPVVDIVFVLDTTGSMQARIATMAQGLAQFAQNVADAGGSDVAFGIYAFGDIDCRGDVQRWVMPLTALSGGTTVAQVTSTLTSGLPRNDGCDAPEDSVLAGATVAATAAWRPGSQREEIVVTDIAGYVRSSPLVDGQPPNVATWQSIAADKDIHVSIVNAAGGTGNIDFIQAGAISLSEMSAIFGSDANIAPKTSAEYTELLTNRVVFGGVAPAYTIVPALTVTYSDGTPSTDITATISPSGPTVVSTTPVDFGINATSADLEHIVRPGATTTAYVEFTEQDSGVIVARQIVTFTAPDKQTVGVVFVDDDAAGAAVTPVAGFQATFDGFPGTAVGFTEAMARAGIPAGYLLASIDNVDQFPAAGAPARTITVHLTHDLDRDTLTTTRTVHYTGAGAATPPDSSNAITWNVVTDKVSHVTTYTTTATGYPDVTSPAVAGYAPDVPVVPALAVTPSTTTAPASVSVTVTYDPTTQAVDVVFVDDDATGAPVTPVTGFQARRTGPSGSAVGFTEAIAATGVPVGYLIASLDNVAAYDFDDHADQTITVHLVHEMRIASVAPSRIIHYTGAGPATPADVVQTTNWKATTDLVTGVTTYTTDDAGYPALPSPKLDGYTVDVAEVAALAVVSPSGEEPKSLVVTVTYTRIIVETGGTTTGSAAAPPALWLGLLLGVLGLAGVRIARRYAMG